MALTKTQRGLVAILKKSGMEPDGITGSVLLLHKSEPAMAELGIWVYDNKVTDGSAILEKAMELHDALPPEQRTGKPVEAP